jgi:stage II sporulation protein D
MPLMGRRLGRWATLAAVGVIAWIAIALAPLSCTRQRTPAPPAETTPVVRVRLLANQDRATLRVSSIPTVKAASEIAALRLNMNFGVDVAVTLTPTGQWQIGGVTVPGSGELTVWPSQAGSVAVNGKPYRGSFRFVPVTPTAPAVAAFDVVNDVDIDSYLKGVLARELLRGWNAETYYAQAIVARTYALHEAKMRGRNRHWDLFPDQRSQVYGGVDDESAKSREAASETAGIVLAYGQPGTERIFKTYFSACCGGVSQSAADAFGEPYVVPLSDQDLQGLCSQAPRYNWGPVEISKEELTRRLRAYGARPGRERGEKDMAMLARLEIQLANRFNRPVRFVIVDVNDQRYSISGEELRIAINAGAKDQPGTRVHSSFFKVVNEPGSDVIRIVEGHGNGHGVGLCQYCSEARADAGMRHEDIVLSAFPRAKLVRAY